MSARTNRIVAEKRERKRLVDELERELDRKRGRTLRPDPLKSLVTAAVILAAFIVNVIFLAAVVFVLTR